MQNLNERWAETFGFERVEKSLTPISVPYEYTPPPPPAENPAVFQVSAPRVHFDREFPCDVADPPRFLIFFQGKRALQM